VFTEGKRFKVQPGQQSLHGIPRFFFSKLRSYFEGETVYLIIFHRGMVQPSFVSLAIVVLLVNSYRSFSMWRNIWFKTYVEC
jgi:hypothetical protein